MSARAACTIKSNVKDGIRFAVVAVTICSWFAISNHCAFASLATKTDSVQSGCPFHSKPAKQEKQPTGAQCCKILRAIVPVVAKNWSPDHATFSDAEFYAEEGTGVDHLRTVQAPVFLDTGPPDARSFAELILQESLRAHAPPSLA